MDAPPVAPSGGAWLPPLISAAFSGWSRTWRVRRYGYDRVHEAIHATPGRAVVFAFWHGEQLAFIGAHRHLPVVGMASQSRDGELLARCVEGLGYPALVRGSTSRGGKLAFQASLDRIAAGLHPGLAVDGPRGPRQQPHVGAVALAAHAGVPVAWVVSRARPRLRLSSWDRFEIPGPFARVDLVYGLLPPVEDPDDRGAVEQARLALGAAMRAASAHLEAGGEAALTPGVATPP